MIEETKQSVTATDLRGIVFDIQRASLQDGPGLRTTVFLKGCPLRCEWCHNPESWKTEPQLGRDGKQYGSLMTVTQVMKIVKADIAYYENSGGGLTLSGGEPTQQFDFCLALLQAAKSADLHTCLDTSGYLEQEKLERLLPWVDLFHFDLKATGESQHFEQIGVGQKLILSNLHWICEMGKTVILRCPMIPDINDSSEHFSAIAELLDTHPQILQVEFLPYHSIGISKFKNLGMQTSPFKAFNEPTDKEKEKWMQHLTRFGPQRVKVN